MLKHILIVLILGISTPIFCSVNQLNHTVIATISGKNESAKKQNKFIDIKIARIKKRFPVFGVASFIATLLGLVTGFINSKKEGDRGSWGMLAGALLLLLAIFLGIAGLVAGEFWVYPVLGILLPIIVIVLFAIAVSKE
jgi:ABC-type polysaccharide/polyol phosphate export permease